MAAISVIIPVYNGERYLQETLESVLRQTFSDFELLLVDDGSTDATPAICREFAKKDARVRVIRQENGGVSSARNTGIRHATGEYIAFVDGDDDVAPTMLAILYEHAKRYDLDISCCGIAQRSLSGKVSSYADGSLRLYEGCEELCRLFFTDRVTKEIFYGPYCKIIRRAIVSAVMFEEQFRIAEDILFNFECLEGAGRVGVLNEALYYYIKRPHSATTSAFSAKRFDYIRVCELLTEKCQRQHPSAYESALVWQYENKQDICRILASSRAYRTTYGEQYREYMRFCKRHYPTVKRNLPFGKKRDYYLLRTIPFIFALLER